jgi:hypothetical protein
MHKVSISAILVAAALALCGCASPKRVIAVSPTQFEAAYRVPSFYWGLRTEFRPGSRYAEIDFYRWGTLDWSEYTGTWRVPAERLPVGLLREARTVFQGGPDLTVSQKQSLDEAIQKARAVGLFAPELFPAAPTVARMKK